MASTMAIQDTLTVLGVDSQDITDFGTAVAVLAVEAAKAIKPLDQVTQAFENVQGSINTTVAGVAEVGRVAETVGLSARALQEYRFAANQVGIASADLDEIMKSLALHVGQVQLGSEEFQGKALEALKTDSGNDLEGVVTNVAELIRTAESAQKAYAIAVQFFGELGDEAVNLFRLADPKELNESRTAANDNNLVFGQEQIDAAAAAQADFATIGARIDAAAARGTIESATFIIENLERLLDRFADFEDASPEEQRRRTTSVIEAKEAEAANIEEQREELLKTIDNMEAKIEDFWNQEDIDAAREGIVAWQSDVSDLTVELIGVNKEIIGLKQTLEQISQITPEANDAIGRSPGRTEAEASETGQASNSSQQSTSDAHRFASGGTLRQGQLGIVGEEGPEFAVHTPFGTVITPMSNAGSTRGRGIGDFGAAGGGRVLSGLAAGGGEQTDSPKPFGQTLETIRTGVEELEELFENISNITFEKIGDSIEEDINDGLEKADEVTNKALKSMGALVKSVTDTALDRLTDDIVNLNLSFDSLKNIGKAALEELKAGFQDIARTALKDLLDVLKQVIKELLNFDFLSKQTAGTLGGGGGSGGGILEGLFNIGASALTSLVGGINFGGGVPAPAAASSGNIFHSVFPAAEGGTLRRGQLGIVGEEGPEFAIHRPSGTQIVPMRANIGALSGRGPAGNAPIIVNQSFDFRRADNSSVAQLRQESERIKRETVAEVAHQAQQGGSFAKAIGKI